MKNARFLIVAGTLILALGAATVTTGCSSSSNGSTRTHVSYGVGYRGYYRDPWRYRPVYGGGIGPGIGGGPPMATQLPEMGMPDFGGMDFGGFDF